MIYTIIKKIFLGLVVTFVCSVSNCEEIIRSEKIYTGESAVDELLNEMYVNQTELKKSSSIILRLHSEYLMHKSAFFPLISFEAYAGQDKNILQDSGKRTDIYKLSVPVSYEIDVWQKIKDESVALSFFVSAAEQEKDAVKITLTAELLQRYYAGLFLIEKIKIYDKKNEILKEQKEKLDKLFEAGFLQENVLAEKNKDIIFNVTQRERAKVELKKTENAICLLTMREFSQGWLNGNLEIPLYLEKYPKNLDNTIFNNRPDIKAIQEKIKAYGYRISAAEKMMKPVFSIRGETSFFSSEFQGLMDKSSREWNLLGFASIPLFDGGKRRQKSNVEKYSKLEFENDLAIAFQKAIMDTYLALSEIDNLENYAKNQKRRVELQEKNVEIFEKRYENGVESFLNFSNEQLSLLNEEEEFFSVIFSLISSEISLYRATGYAWWIK